jgi:type I restriction enzyme S subunit
MNLDKSRWPRVRFGDVVTLNTDRCAEPVAAGIERYVGLEHIEPEDLRIRRWGLVEEGTTFTNRFRPGQVLFGKRRAYQRKVAVADFEGVCSSDIYVFEPKDERLLPELLPFLCQTEAFYEHAVGTSAGSLSPRTNWTQLANYEFALPPLEEQRRIVSVLRAQNSLLERLTYSEASARSLLRSTIFGLASEFPFQALSSATTFITSGSRGWAAHYMNEGAWFLRAGNLTRDNITLDLEELKKVNPPNNAEGVRTRVKGGDILVAITGIYLGKIGLVTDDIPEAYVNQHIAMVRIDQERFDPRFIAYMLTSPVAQREVWRRNEGGTKPGMTLAEVGGLPIPAIPYSQQSQLADSLDQINAVCTSLAVRCAAAKQLYRFTIDDSMR